MKLELDKKENIEERKVSFGERFSLKLRKGIIGNKGKTVLAIIIIILAFFAINLWANNNNFRQIDLTENKYYTLSQTSKDIIKKVDEPVTIYIYGFEENSMYVNFIKQYQACNPNISYEIATETTHYDIITEYRLGYYNEILVKSETSDTTLSVYDFETSEYINGVVQYINVAEQCLTNAILKVTDKDPVKIYFVSGHGELADDELTFLIDYLEMALYEYEFVNLFSATEIPADCDVLAILSPTIDYTESEANIIIDYIKNGGEIMAAMVNIDFQGEFINLQRILDQFAVSINPGVLYDTNPSNHYAIANQDAPMVLLPNYSSITEITSDIEYSSIFSMVQAIDIDYSKIEELQVVPQELLFTSTKTYNVLDYANDFNTEGLQEDVYIFGRVLTKTIPSEVENEEGKESKLIIVGNDTFLADYDSLIRDYPISYMGNMDFTLNCFKYLTNKSDTLEIHKNIDISTFTATAQQDKTVQAIVFITPVIIIFVGIIINIYRRKIR